MPLNKTQTTYYTQQASFSGVIRSDDGSFAVGPAGALPGASQFQTIGIERVGAAERFGIAGVLEDGRGGIGIGRGQVLERVSALSQGLAVTWTFPGELAGSGDALVRVQLKGLSVTSSSAQATLLRTSDTSLELRVGAARWIDAAGASTAIAQEVTDGVLAFRVPEALLKSSKYPAVLDPVFALASAGNVTFDTAAPADPKLTVGEFGPGIVTSSDSNISCGATCSFSYATPTTVTLTATPTGGGRFVGWSGFCGGNATCTLDLKSDTFVYAYFEPATWPVKVVKVGGGSGSVSGAGIACPASSATCSVDVANTVPPASVTFTATADGSSVFTGFSADCGGTACNLLVDRPKTVYATFSPSNFTVTVNVTGVNGAVTLPDSSVCTGAAPCSFSVAFANPASTVTLTAGGTGAFIGWSGDCSGQSPTCSLAVTKNENVFANFYAPGSGTAGHDTTYANSTVHGPAYQAFVAQAPGALQCTLCHGANLEGTSSAPSCTQCHGAPHGADLTSTVALQAQHGAAFASSFGQTQSCTSCHGADLKGSSTAPSCSQCHGAPHDPTPAWGTYVYPVGAPHPAAYYISAGQDPGATGCFDCHAGKNFMGAVTKGLAAAAPLTAPACFECHSSFNHNGYTHPAAYEGEFYSGGRTGYTPGFFGSFTGAAGGPMACPSNWNTTGEVAPGSCSTGPTYNVPDFAYWGYALPAYGSYKPGADTWEPNCIGCHGTASTRGTGIISAPLQGFKNGAPSCAECHYMPPLPEVLGNNVPAAGPTITSITGTQITQFTNTKANHFTANKEAWALYSFSQACERCHTSGGFQDYVGATGAANNLSRTFNIDGLGAAGTQNLTNGGYAAGPLTCATCHNNTTDPSRDTLHGIHVPGLTSIGFPSLIQRNNVDKGRALCGTCHQARVATSTLVSSFAKSYTAGPGLTFASYTANLAGTNAGGTITMRFAAPTAAPTAPVTPGVGYTAIFNGNATPALNGVSCTVASYTVSGANATVACTLPTGSTATAAPAFNTAPVPCSVLATATSNTSCFTDATFAALIVVPVASAQLGYSKGSDSATFYPTATGGAASRTTLIDANRSWTAGQWDSGRFNVFFVTGANAGRHALITSNTTNTLTFAAMPGAVAAGDFYQIVPTDQDDNFGTLAGWNAGTGKGIAATLTTTNPHYLGSAATEFGSEAAGFYQYPGKVYAGHAAHIDLTKVVDGGAVVAAATCVDCHDAHSLEIQESACVSCHGATAEQMKSSLSGIGGAYADWVGDGTTYKLGVSAQIEALKAKLLQGINAYATLKTTKGICFDNGTNAYWFVSSPNDVAAASRLADGTCGVDATGNFIPCCYNSQSSIGGGWGATPGSASGVSTGTGSSPRLYRATYNYKFAMKDLGAWAHNPRYVAQVLYDAIADLNAGGITPIAIGTRPQ